MCKLFFTGKQQAKDQSPENYILKRQRLRGSLRSVRTFKMHPKLIGLSPELAWLELKTVTIKA